MTACVFYSGRHSDGRARVGVGDARRGEDDEVAMEEDGDASLVRLMREYESCAGDDGGGGDGGGDDGGGGDARMTRARRAGDEIGVKRAREDARGEAAGKRASLTAETTRTMTMRTMPDGSSASSMTMSSGDVDMAMSPLRAKLPWGGGFPADPSAAR